MSTIETIFDWFLAATVRGSLLALAVILLQLALRRRLPATWNLALWLPVVWVLGSPVLPESPWSIEGPIQSISVLVERSPVNPVIDPVEVSSAAASSALGREAVSWKRIAAIVWLGGAGVVLCLGIAVYFRELRRLGRKQILASPILMGELAAAAHVCGLRRIPRILLSLEAHSPAVTGLFRPILLLPADFAKVFDFQERHLVLLHELFHLKRGDLPVNWLLFVLQALHWCNPVVWFAFARLRADRETACDSAVLGSSGENSHGVYGLALLKLECTGVPAALSLAFVGLFGRGPALRSRIVAIAGHRKSNPAWAVPGIALIFGLSLVGATRAQNGTPTEETAGPHILIETKFIEVPADLKFEIIGESSTYDNEKGFMVSVQSPADAAALVETLTKAESVDVLSAPSLLTLSGQKATVETGRELPDQSGESRNIGVSLVVLPKLEGDRILLAVEARSSTVLDAKFAETKFSSKVTITPGQSVVLAETTTQPGAKAGRRLILTLSARVAADPKAVREKLDRMILPQVVFNDAPISDAISFLREKSRELDPDKVGVNILQIPNSESKDVRVTLSLTNVPFSEALRYTAALANLEVEFGDPAVILRKAAPPAPVSAAKSENEARVSRIVIPRMEFRDSPLTDTLAFLRIKSLEHDPEKKGINLILNSGGNTPPVAITLSLANVPLNEALRYVAELAGLKLRYDADAVVLFRE